MLSPCAMSVHSDVRRFTTPDREVVPGGRPVLRWTLRAVGGVAVVFFLATPLAVVGVITPDGMLGRLVLWGHGGDEYLVMLAVINIVLGGYLFWAARDPVVHWQAIDIFMVAESAHVASMAVMAVWPDHRMHWFGDVAVPALGLVVLAIVWLPRRSAVRLNRPAAGVSSRA